MFVCSLTPPKGRTQRAEILMDDSPWGADVFRLKKNFQILPTVRQKTEKNAANDIVATILCIILGNTTENHYNFVVTQLLV